MYLLDTNVISELRRGKRGQSPAVRAWAQAQPLARLYLSAVTVLELELGALLIGRRDKAQAQVLRTWLDAVLADFDGRVLPFAATTALRCAPLHVPDPASFRDSMIAATALEHGFAVVTRNGGDLAASAVPVIDPWQP
jgi:toxin FitB